MGFSIRFLQQKNSQKDFKKLNSNLQERIKKKFEEVRKNPERYKHLHYDLQRSCRIWVEKTRIIFSYDKEKKELYLEKIAFDHKYR